MSYFATYCAYRHPLLGLLVAVFFAAPAALKVRAADALKPNIVLIYADDLDADELGCTDAPNTWPSYTGKVRLKIKGGTRNGRGGGYADPRMLTPHIDSLAAGGVILTRFYITSPVCTPSRYTLLTGRLATRSPGFLKKFPPGGHATLGWDASLDSSESSLAKSLQQAGYKTGVVGKWHNFVQRKTPTGKGDSFFKQAVLPHNPTLEELQQPGMSEMVKTNYERSLAILRDGYGWDFVDRINIGNSVINLEWMIEGALQFVERCDDQPFFLYVSLPVPHGQYSADYCNLKKLESRATAAGVIDQLPEVMPSRASVFQRLRAAGISPRNAMATHMDDAVGAILKKLDDLQLRENTLVLYISDHGSRGKNSCYESAARVPALANWPARIKPGGRIGSLTGNMDVAATLIAVAGGELPHDISQDSRSILPQLLGQPDPNDWRKAVLLEIGNTKAAVGERWKYIANRVPPQAAARIRTDAERSAKTGEPRRVFWSGVDHHSYGAELDFPNYFDADQFYDLENDLYETANLADDPAHTDELATMKRQLRVLLESLPHEFGEFK